MTINTTKIYVFFYKLIIIIFNLLFDNIYHTYKSIENILLLLQFKKTIIKNSACTFINIINNLKKDNINKLNDLTKVDLNKNNITEKKENNNKIDKIF